MKHRTTAILFLAAIAGHVYAQPEAQPGIAPTVISEDGGERVVARFRDQAITAEDLEPDARTIEMNRRTYDDDMFQQMMAHARYARLNGFIFGALLDEFRQRKQIEVTEAEIDQFIEASEKAEAESNREFRERAAEIASHLKDSPLSESERARLEKEAETLASLIRSDEEFESWAREQWGEDFRIKQRESNARVARQMIMDWKTSKALFEEYGGRVIFQQAGPEPLDAYRKFLEEHEAAGDFEIIDPELKTQFWRYFVNDSMHVFYDEREGAKWMNTPWWLQKETP